MATLYVNGIIGDDNLSYMDAQNPSTPWKTIGRSTQTSNVNGVTQNGDTVIVQSGYYRESFWVLGSQSNITWRAEGYVEVIDPGGGMAAFSFGGYTSNLLVEGFWFRVKSFVAGILGANNVVKNCHFYPQVRGSDGEDDATGFTFGLSENGNFGNAINCRLENSSIKSGAGSAGEGFSRSAVSCRIGGVSSVSNCTVSDSTIVSNARGAFDFRTDNPSVSAPVVKFLRCIIVGKNNVNAEGAVLYTPNGLTNNELKLAFQGSDDNLYFDLGAAPPSLKILKNGASTLTLADFKAIVAPSEAASEEGDPRFWSIQENAYILKAGSPALAADGITKKRGAWNRGHCIAHSDTPRWGGTDPAFPDGNAGFVSVTNNIIELKAGTTGAVRRSGANEGAPTGSGIRRFCWEEEPGLTFDTIQSPDDRIYDRTPHVDGSPNPIHIGVEVNDGTSTGAYANIERNEVLATPLTGSNVHFEMVARNNYKVN